MCSQYLYKLMITVLIIVRESEISCQRSNCGEVNGNLQGADWLRKTAQTEVVLISRVEPTLCHFWLRRPRKWRSTALFVCASGSRQYKQRAPQSLRVDRSWLRGRWPGHLYIREKMYRGVLGQRSKDPRYQNRARNCSRRERWLYVFLRLTVQAKTNGFLLFVHYI